MSILVTGGAGYIGSHMVHALVDRGERVIVIDDLSTGVAENLPEAARLVVGDVGDETLVANLLREEAADAIIHFAGSIIVTESITSPLKYYSNNTAKSRNLIASAIDTGVKAFVFSSTAAIFGEPPSIEITEATPPAPLTPYGVSKLMTEWMLRDVAAVHPLRYAVLRYFNVAGADPAGRTGQSTPDSYHLIKIACATALGRRPGMAVFGTDYPTRDGTGIRDYIHVVDLIDAHLLAIDYLRGGGGSVTLNCGYGRGDTVLEVIAAVKRVSGVDFPVTYAGRREGDPSALVARSDRLRKLLGWRPRFDDLDTIVRHALQWETQMAARGIRR